MLNSGLIIMIVSVLIVAFVYRRLMLGIYIPLQMSIDFLFPLMEINDAVTVAVSGDDEPLKKILEKNRQRITNVDIIYGAFKNHRTSVLRMRLAGLAHCKLDDAKNFVLEKEYRRAYEVLCEANNLIWAMSGTGKNRCSCNGN